MNDILNAIKIEEIYNYNLMYLKEIVDYLEISDLSEDDINQIENDAKSILEKKFGIKPEELTSQQLHDLLENEEFKKNYNHKLTYGEISKKGVNTLSKYLWNFSGVFYDIGSGNGKLTIHLSLLCKFQKYIGVEISRIRHLYSEKIKEGIKPENVSFVLADVLDLNLSDANFIFMNDLVFPEELAMQIIFNIPKNCHYLTTHKTSDEFIETLNLDVSWWNLPVNFHLYKK